MSGVQKNTVITIIKSLRATPSCGYVGPDLARTEIRKADSEDGVALFQVEISMEKRCCSAILRTRLCGPPLVHITSAPRRSIVRTSPWVGGRPGPGSMNDIKIGLSVILRYGF